MSRAWARWLAAGLIALALATSNVASAQQAIVACVKVEHLLVAARDYNHAYSEAELAKLDPIERRLAGAKQQLRLVVPGLFEITSDAESPDAIRGDIVLRVKPQGHSNIFSINTRSIAIGSNDVMFDCPDDSAALCLGEYWHFVGDGATASLFYIGRQAATRAPLLSVEKTSFCDAERQHLSAGEAIDRLKAYLKGPRIP